MNEAGLYVHIPFCRQKCPYCHFYSVTHTDLLVSFLDSLKREMEMYRGVFPRFATVYIGGGSPSLLSARFMEELIHSLNSNFSFQSPLEVTVEANPADQDIDWYRALFACGVNRLVIGVQSTDDKELAFLGRRHRSLDAFSAVDKARKAGFENIAIDLIYGLPNQSVEDWTDRLKKAVSLSPSHLSCYELTLEEETPFYKRAKEGTLILPDEEMKWQLFRATHDYLETRGYIHYEVSNFARGAHFYSRHNLLYWQRKPYLGLGPSAHSFDGVYRWWNAKSVTRYMELTKEGHPPLAGKEKLTPEDVKLEEFMLGLRTREGIKMGNSACPTTVERLLKEDYLKREGDKLVPTVKGMACADQVALIMSLR